MATGQTEADTTNAAAAVSRRTVKRRPLNCSTLTLRLYRGLGYHVYFVERKIRHGKFTWKIDFGGFADHIAYRPDKPGCLALQSCAWSGFAAHRTKILRLTAAYDWIQAGNRLAIVAWKRAEKRGRPSRRKLTHIELTDFELDRLPEAAKYCPLPEPKKRKASDPSSRAPGTRGKGG